MDDKQKTHWQWIVAALTLLLVAYVLSFGPACWIVNRGWLPAKSAAVVYSPVFVIDARPVYEALFWYSKLFVPSPRTEDLFTAAWARHSSRSN